MDEKYIRENFIKVGEIYQDPDTANWFIMAKDKIRMLVVFEHIELMEPTKPCVQLGAQKIWKEIEAKGLL
jgi:hypothetical protein